MIRPRRLLLLPVPQLRCSTRLHLLLRRRGYEVVFVPSWSVFDGRFANNGWLQETPDPMTKLTWDNAALVSPATAKKLGVAMGDVIAIERNGRKVEGAVMVQPGQADDSITVPLGYGRTKVGQVGEGAGFNAYAIRTSDTFGFGTGFNVIEDGRQLSACAHAGIRIPGRAETGRIPGSVVRPIVREGTLEHFKKEPAFCPGDGGASAAEIAIRRLRLLEGPAVGDGHRPERLHRLQCLHGRLPGREQHSGRRQGAGRARPRDALDPPRPLLHRGRRKIRRLSPQPIPCMQCETAPCENVCPVAATVHSPEGLNDMVYNRCVGTRYCSNNCPYKVRRFNFLNWHEGMHEVQQDGVQPRSHRPHARRDGEVHLLRAAHPEREDRRQGLRAAAG